MRIMWAVILRLMMVAGLCASTPVAPSVTAQQSQSAAQQASETFAGTVVELTAERVTVARSILGGTAERRSFLLKPDTRVEGKLRAKARVTVGFINTNEGDVALLIVVREKKKQ